MGWTSNFKIRPGDGIYQQTMTVEQGMTGPYCKYDWVKSTREEVESRFCEAFPHLYKNASKGPEESCMYWGFECGPGWFHLLWKLSDILEKYIMIYIKDNGDCDTVPCAAQVKEKFGGLRFYMDFATEDMYKEIEKAELEAEKTCEKCGAPGRIRGKGWVCCECDECEQRRNLQ